MNPLKRILLLGGVVCGVLISHPADAQDLPYTCEVMDWNASNGLPPERMTFMERDSLGYLWLFSHQAMARFDGKRFRTFYYSEELPEFGQHEFLRGVFKLPSGELALQFGEKHYGVEEHNAFSVWNPYELHHERPTECLPPLRKDDVVYASMRPAIGSGATQWFVMDTVHQIPRVLAEDEAFGDSLVTRVVGADSTCIEPLFSAPHEGDFYLVTPWNRDSTGMIHARGGETKTAWNAFCNIRANYRLRRHQNHTMWFEPDGSMLHWVWRAEDHPEHADDGFAIQTLDRGLIPDTASLEGTDWSDFINLKHGYRGSEVRYNPTSRHIWIFSENELHVHDQFGKLLAHTVLDPKRTWTQTIHDVLFVNGQEALVLSASGLCSIALSPNPFTVHEIPFKEKQNSIGWRNLVSWNEDTLLFRTDALGIHQLSDGRIEPIQLGEENDKGLYVSGDTLFILHKGEIAAYTGFPNPTRVQRIPVELRWTWGLGQTASKKWWAGNRELYFGDHPSSWRYYTSHGANVYQVLESDACGWLVATGAGVQLIDAERGALRPASEQFPELGAIKSGCHALLEDSAGGVWISTSGEGLFAWNAREATLRQYSARQGLPSNTVYGALQDRRGRMWGSTDQGLFQLDPTSGEVAVYGIRRGIPEVEFNRTSFLRHFDGRFFFGGVYHGISFHPDSIDSDLRELQSSLHPVVDRVLQHQRDDRAVDDVTEAYRATGRLMLGPSDDFIAIRMAVPEFMDRRFDYEFRIQQAESFNDALDWQPVFEDQITCSSFSPGRYVLEIRARCNELGWLDSRADVNLVVSYPFYQRAWVRIGFFVLVFGMLWVVQEARNRGLARRNQRLEDRVKRRTESLREAIQEKEAYLAETHHRVKNNLQIISSLLELQALQMDDEVHREQFNLSKSRIDAINLIHQRMLSEEGERVMELKSYLVELMRLIERGQVAQQDEVHLEVTGEDVTLRLKEMVPLGMIFNELMTNTIKHVVPQARECWVRVDIASEQGDWVEMNYRDSGPGLTSGLRFDESQSLGLRLVGRFTHQLQGSVEVLADGSIALRIPLPS